MKRINYPVDYATLKKAIRKSAVATDGLNFFIDFEKLNSLVAESGLTVVPNMVKSRRLTREDVAFIGEFFRGKDLEWINQYKALSSVIFIKTESIDDRALALMHEMTKPQIEDPDIDKVNVVATLLANYPCYTAAIVSYKSNDLKRRADLCYEIVCKANKVTIDTDNKEYHKPVNPEEVPVPTPEPVVEEPEDEAEDDIVDETGNEELD